MIGLSLAINLCEGIYHPSRYQFINHSITNRDKKNAFLLNLQSIDSIMMIIGPAIAGFLISMFNPQICFILDGVTYGLSFIFWLLFIDVNAIRYHKFTDILLGYKLLFSNKNLVKINLGRLLSNSMAILWGITLPIMIVNNFEEVLFAKIQGICLCFTALGLILTNFYLSRLAIHKKYGVLEIILLRTAFFSICTGLLLLYYMISVNINFILLWVTALMFGIITASLRSASIIIGQNVTPQDYLHLIMASGDSIVRLGSALLALLTGTILAKYNNAHIYNVGIIISFVSCILALIFYKSIIKADYFDSISK